VAERALRRQRRDTAGGFGRRGSCHTCDVYTAGYSCEKLRRAVSSLPRVTGPSFVLSRCHLGSWGFCKGQWWCSKQKWISGCGGGGALGSFEALRVSQAALCLQDAPPQQRRVVSVESLQARGALEGMGLTGRKRFGKSASR
jgi:hypothetical protein